MVNMDDWSSRWRVENGSSPGGLTDAMFGLLMELGPDDIPLAAQEVGVDGDRLAWWREIADDDARHHLAGLRPSQYEIMRVIREAGPLSDQELGDRFGDKTIQSVIPRRSELTRAGLVTSAGKTKTKSGRSANVWRAASVDEIEHLQQAAEEKGKRRKKLTDYTVDEQVRIVKVLVNIPKVNDALRGDASTTNQAKRARREARAAQREHEQRRREWAERVRQAERDASPELNFLKAMGQLRRGTDAVREIAKVFKDDLDALEFDGHMAISSHHWREARDQVGELLQLAEQLDHALGVALGDIEQDYIDMEPLDDEDLELMEG
jgi:hypothetical protein